MTLLDSVLVTDPENVEATSGFEPLNRGFADLSTPSQDTPVRAAEATPAGSRGLASAGVLASVLDTERWVA